MRSIETLVREYPNKTGKEILEIQNQDKLQDEMRRLESNKKVLSMIEDYNSNGAYFKSTFGLHQYRYDKFTDLTLEEDGRITCKVESIVGFYTTDSKSSFKNEINLERKTKDVFDFYKYSPQEENRITEKEYNALSNHLNNIFVEFWGLIDSNR